MNLSICIVFLKNRNFISKIRISKVTDYAALKETFLPMQNRCTNISRYNLLTGFGLLEAGCVSRRNEVNIMVKNAVDVVFGGVSYWIFGFGLSFGNEAGSNSFNGVGLFFVDTEDETMGLLYSTYVFQLSFATTATTIVSGAMAERTKLLTYIIFSFLNTIVYCIPAHWEWAEKGTYIGIMRGSRLGTRCVPLFLGKSQSHRVP